MIKKQKKGFVRTLDWLTADSQTQAIRQAVEAGDTSSSWLVDLLTHKEEHVRTTAAKAPKQLGRDAVISAIQTRIQGGVPSNKCGWNSDSCKVEAFLLMIEVLQAILDPRVTPMLTELLGCKNDAISAKAAEALAQIGGDPNATEPLVKTLLDKEQKHRCWCIWRPVRVRAVIALIVLLIFATGGSGLGGV